MGRRYHAVRHPRPQHRFIHHARIDALQPIIPPTQDFLEKSDLGSGKCKVRIGMCPRPDETLAGHLQPLEQAWDGILITIGPTTDGIDRALDRCVVLTYRSVLPIRIASLVLPPIFLEQRYVLQALNHIARQLSPTSAGSGGRHIKLKKKKAHSRPAVVRNVPPM